VFAPQYVARPASSKCTGGLPSSSYSRAAEQAVPTGQLTPPPSVIGSRSGSICAGESDQEQISVTTRAGQHSPGGRRQKLQSILRHAWDCVQGHAVAAPIRNQGWFQPEDPDNCYAELLAKEIGHLDLSQTVDLYFRRGEDQKAYGATWKSPQRAENAKFPTSTDCHSGTEDDPLLLTTKTNSNEQSRSKHKKNEKERRTRHRTYQRLAHERCGDLVVKLGRKKAESDNEGTKPQAGKGPGKDEQLCTAIFHQEYSGRLVQVLNERRLVLEEAVKELVEKNRELEEKLAHLERAGQNLDQPDMTTEYVGEKRRRVETEPPSEWIHPGGLRIQHDVEGSDNSFSN
jgi:hypothetical protein